MTVEAEAVPVMVGVILLIPRDVAVAAFTRPTEDADNLPLEDKPLPWRKAALTLGDHLPCDPERIPVEILVLDQQFQESLLGFHLGFLFVGGVNAIVDAH